jgi:methionine-rich copper-binding protein CopC
VVYGISNIIFCLFLLVSITVFVCLNTNNTYAHITQENKTAASVQEWKNIQDNVKIQFSYIPERPLVYTATELIFSTQDLTTGNHIKDLIASITITKNDKISFKFNDVNIQNGDLSLRVRFVEDGNYQVISQISSRDNIAIALASFDIYVPLQPFGKFNADSLISSLIPAGSVAISLSAIVIALILILRKREKSRKAT